MNKYLVLIILVLLVSCEKLLFHEEEDAFMILDKESEKLELLNGIYYQLTRVHDENYFMTCLRAEDVNVYMNYSFHYDNQVNTVVGCTTSGGGNLDIGQYADEIYIKLYRAILNANKLIGQLDEEQDAGIIGEACFLRAYCYFKMARLFGRPPLVTDLDVDFVIHKPTYREVYEQIETDLLKAIDLLPDNYAEARVPGETPNKGTARALLAEVYLAMAGYPVGDESKYAEAARLAGEVIDQSEYYNYALLDDLADLWNADYRHNPENVFGLFFSGETDETSNWIGANQITLYTDLQLWVDGRYNPEFKFFNDYPENYRKYTVYATGRYWPFTIEMPDGTYEFSLYFEKYNPLFNACNYIDGCKSLKWLDIKNYRREDQLERMTSYHNTNLTLYLLRYAHTLLTYAEAKARAGELDASCFEAVNRVRRRANKVDIYTPGEFDLPASLTNEQFIDSVVWERAWELCNEPDGRWFDIIRLDLRTKLPENRYSIDLPTPVSNAYLTDDWYFCRIPQHDRWINPNLEEEEQ